MSDSRSSKRAAREARHPVQERSSARMAQVLSAARKMLEQIGPERTSIPALADAAGVPRASIYPFFPDKQALFAHLAQIEMQGLTEALQQSKAVRTRSWLKWVETAIDVTAAHYNAHPVASMLLLNGAFAEVDRAAHEAKNKVVGDMLRTAFARMGALPALPATPDVATIAVEIAFACMKHGYAQSGRIDTAICTEATRAVTAYLGHWAADAG